MAVDSVDVVTKTESCFCEVITPLMRLLLSVDIVDVVFRATKTQR